MFISCVIAIVDLCVCVCVCVCVCRCVCQCVSVCQCVRYWNVIRCDKMASNFYLLHNKILWYTLQIHACTHTHAHTHTDTHTHTHSYCIPPLMRTEEYICTLHIIYSTKTIGLSCEALRPLFGNFMKFNAGRWVIINIHYLKVFSSILRCIHSQMQRNILRCTYVGFHTI